MARISPKSAPCSTLPGRPLVVPMARRRSPQAHQAHFPRGALREESDAIEFQAMMLLHDGNAYNRGRQFLAKYPKSLYGPAIDAALQAAQ